MEVSDIYEWVIITAPAISALLCLGFVGVSSRACRDGCAGALRIVLCMYYVFTAVSWVMLAFHFVSPTVFVRFASLSFLSFLVLQVLFYHFVYLLTRSGRAFSLWHYVPPVVLSGVLFVCGFHLPLDVHLQVLSLRGDSVPGYEVFSVFSNSRLPVRVCYCLFYCSLSFYRLWQYRQEVVHYSADESRSSLDWVYLLLLLTIFLNFAPLVMWIWGASYLKNPLVMLILVVLLIVEHPVFYYNLLTHNYVMIVDAPHPANQPVSDAVGVQPPSVHASGGLTRASFEAFMAANRPHLDPGLKITDITPQLHTNRTYLSTFINTEYGMNFNAYINSLRLSELEQMLHNPAYAGFSNLELIIKAGFGSYHSYIRSWKRIKGEEILKPE